MQLFKILKAQWCYLLLTSTASHAFSFGMTKKGSAPAISRTISPADLDKKSTALDVLRSLNYAKKLAPFVNENGVAVVTGGSSGIGSVSVETLALAGMRVVLCAQNVTKAQKVIDNFDGSVDKSKIRIQTLNLSDLNSVKAAAEEIQAKEGKIDLLLNNAGVMAIPTKEVTVQGFEKQLGINHIGHHYLTRKLLPQIQEGGRVVTVASTAHTIPKTLELEDLNYEKRKYTPWEAYGQTKLANILFAKELQDRFGKEERDVLSVCVHPGVIKTGLWKYTTGDNFLFEFLTGLIADKNIDQGAATNLFCSLVESDSLIGGAYYNDCKVGYPSANGRDESKKLRRTLWAKTEAMLKNAGFSEDEE